MGPTPGDIIGPAHLTFSLPLDPARLLRARHRIHDYLDQHGASEDVVDSVVLAIEEAMTNAVRHSGAADNLLVHLHFEGCDLFAEVRDHGRGFELVCFDRERTPDPLRTDGRGLFLISRLMDDLELTCDGGLIVSMRKRDAVPVRDSGLSLESGIADAHVLTGDGYREQRLRLLVQELDEGFACLDWEYRLTFVNPAALRLYHLRADEVLGRSLWELFPYMENSPRGLALREAMELGTASIGEFESQPLGRWIEFRLYPTSSGASLYLRDIDERKRKELERDELFATLQENWERLERAQEMAHLGSWELDLLTDELTWSDEVYRIFGLKPREFAATYEAFLQCVHPDDRAALNAAYRASLEKDQDGYEIEHRVICGNTGEIRVILERCRHVRDASGKIIRSLGMAHDISERKRAEEALRQSNIKYQALIESTSDFIWEMDAQARYTYCSPQMERLWGLKPQEMLGKSPLDVMPAEEREQAGPAFKQLFDTPQPFNGLESRALDAQGRLIYLEISGVPFFDEEGKLLGFRGVTRDVTERKRVQEREEKEHRETSFVNGVLQAFVEYEGDALFDHALAIVLQEMASRYGVFGYIARPGYLTCPSLSKMLDACEVEGKCIHYPPEKWKGLWAQALTEKRSLYTNSPPPVPPGHPIIHNNLATPIIFHGQAIGLLNIANKDGGYTDRDRQTLDDLAAHVAPVLYAWIQHRLREDERRSAESELQRLYEEQRQVALALQENFVHKLPKLPGLELASLSRPAGRAELIGGDFSGVFVLPNGLVIVLIGDVVGKGIRAAGLTETVHSAVRTVALIAPSPQFILRRVNDVLLHEGEDDRLVTALLVMLDPESGQGFLSSAGHPPAALLTDDGAELIKPSYGPPLGAFESPYTETRFDLGPGEALVLYTDGVTEARRAGLLFGEKRLLETLARIRKGSPDAIVGALSEAAMRHAGELKDDLEILAIRRSV